MKKIENNTQDFLLCSISASCALSTAVSDIWIQLDSVSRLHGAHLQPTTNPVSSIKSETLRLYKGEIEKSYYKWKLESIRAE